MGNHKACGERNNYIFVMKDFLLLSMHNNIRYLISCHVMMLNFHFYIIIAINNMKENFSTLIPYISI